MAKNFYINTSLKMYSLNGNNYYSVDRYKVEMDIQNNVVIFNEMEDAIGNDIYSNEVMKIDVTADTIIIDGSSNAPGTFTPQQLVAQFKTAFPQANSGNGGSGINTLDDVTQGTTTKKLSAAEYINFKAIEAAFITP